MATAVFCFLLAILYWLLAVLSNPSVDGAILPSGRSIFCAGLTLEDGAIGDGIRMRAPDGAVKKPLEFRLASEHAFLLVVDIQDVQLCRAFGAGQSPGAHETAQHRGAKGIEEKNQAGAGRERKLQGVAAKHAHGDAGAPGSAPMGKIPARDARQRGMQLHAEHGAKGMLGCEQHGAAHAGAKIDKRVFVDGGDRAATPPTHDETLKNRRSHCVIGRNVAVVAMPGGEMTPCDQSAGAHAEFEVEGMADQAVFFGQSGQAVSARGGFPGSSFA